MIGWSPLNPEVSDYRLQVRITIQIQIIIPLAMGIAALIAGQFVSGIILIALAGVAALAFYFWYPPPTLHFGLYIILVCI
jgi:hypothetical protein